MRSNGQDPARAALKRFFAVLLILLILPLSGLGERAQPTGEPLMDIPSIVYHLPVSARAPRVERTRVLDAAFSLLEEDNIFLKQYNALTSAGLSPAYPAGVPYFFGGRDEEILYKIMEAWQDSGHFKKGRNYVYDYDCIGFTKQVYKKAGLPHPDSITDMLAEQQYAPSRVELMSYRYTEWRNRLNVGEMLILRGKTYNHIMIFIGTLRDFGFESRDLGETLQRYIDFPLVIHTAENPWAIARNRRHIEGLGRTMPIYDTDGGVHVAILGVPLIQAPFTVQVDKVSAHAFDVLGTYLPVYDLSQKLSVQGWRVPNSPALQPTPKPTPVTDLSYEGYVELREGMIHPLVKRVKQRLYDLGYYRNNILNNTYSADTAKYIREVQRINLMEETGIATVEFLEFFFSDSVMPFYTPRP